MSDRQFEGKVALVTGGGSGIGRAASLRLAAEGAAVVVADLDEASAQRTAAEIEQAGGRALAIRVDIASEPDNDAMFEAATRVFGGLDMAYLNAGTLQPYIPFEQLTTALFDRVLGINLRGTFFGVQRAQATLRPGGACVATASAAGIIGFAEATAYSVSKHGVVGLVRSASASFAARGLRINAVCPAMVLTGMTGNTERDLIKTADQLQDPKYRGALSAQHIAEVALFLLSRRAAGINGQAQLIDAASLAGFPPLELPS